MLTGHRSLTRTFLITEQTALTLTSCCPACSAFRQLSASFPLLLHLALSRGEPEPPGLQGTGSGQAAGIVLNAKPQSRPQSRDGQGALGEESAEACLHTPNHGDPRGRYEYPVNLGTPSTKGRVRLLAGIAGMLVVGCWVLVGPPGVDRKKTGYIYPPARWDIQGVFL